MNFVGITHSLGGLVILALLGAVALLGLLLTGGGRLRLRNELAGETRVLLGIGALTAAVSMGGSLYFSEVVGFTPCVLCWYQRIAMYPLVLVLGIAAWRRDAGIWRYVLPIAGVGLIISIYHNLIQFRPALDIGTCTPDASCTARHVAAFGFVSIPFMAGAGFLLIGALMLTLRETERAGAADMEEMEEAEEALGAQGPEEGPHLGARDT